MAAPSVTISVMLAVHEKKTSHLDLHKPLRQYIALHYSERQAQDAEDDLETIQQMRNDIEKASDAFEPRRNLLQRYFRSLCAVESRFPISTDKDHVNSLSFTWFDAFKPGKKATQHNIHLEKAAILFNLGAVQSQIALSADRSTPGGLKQACNCFQAAAGAFAFLRDHVSMKASSSNSTVDISIECAGMLERLMLAQAQECFFEKVIHDHKPPSLCSKVSRQVGLYYEEAHAALSLSPLSQHFDRTWVAHVQLKAIQFHGEACNQISLELHEKENIAEEIARLKVASNVLATAKKCSRGAVGPLLDAISKLEANVNLNLERAIKENDRVYLMKIPAENALSPLAAVSLVKPTSLLDVLDASNEKLFAGIVPDSSAKALSKYTELVDEIIRVEAEKLQQESEITRVKLKEMDLPDSLHALEGNASIPEDIRNDVEAVQLDGGPSGLETEMKRLADLRRVNEELLAQTEELLQKEATEDAQFRAQFGTRWTRPQSGTMTKNFHDRLNSFAANLKQAADMDARIERTIGDNWSLLAILDNKPIEAAFPSLSRPIMSLNGEEDAVVRDVRQSLGQLEILASQRAALEDMLKEMKRKDNILPKLMSTSGSHEELFRRELAKYDPVCQEVTKNVEAQEKLLQQLKIQNDAFSRIFNLEDYKASRDRIIKQISIAVSKYRELRDNINNEGMKFYVRLQDKMNILKQECSEFVMTRNTQSRDMMESIQRQLAGFSFRDGNSSLKYPSVSQSPQRPAPSFTPPSVQSAYYPQGDPSCTPKISSTSQMYTHLQHPPPPQSNYLAGRPLPPPPYYMSSAQNENYPHSQMGTPQPPISNHDYSYTPYPGWRGPYYNQHVPSLPNTQYPPPYHVAPTGSYYPPAHGDHSK